MKRFVHLQIALACLAGALVSSGVWAISSVATDGSASALDPTVVQESVSDHLASQGYTVDDREAPLARSSFRYIGGPAAAQFVEVRSGGGEPMLFVFWVANDRKNGDRATPFAMSPATGDDGEYWNSRMFAETIGEATSTAFRLGGED